MSKFKRLSLDEARETFPLLNAEAQQALKGGCDSCQIWTEKGYAIYSKEEYEQMMADNTWGGGAVCDVGYLNHMEEVTVYGTYTGYGNNPQELEMLWANHQDEHNWNSVHSGYCSCGVLTENGQQSYGWMGMMPENWGSIVGSMGGGSGGGSGSGGNTGNTPPTEVTEEDRSWACNTILERLDSPVEKQFFLRYWNSEGDLTLSEEMFDDLKTVVRTKNINYMEGYNIVEIDGNQYYKKAVSFYDNDTYNLAFGTATVYFDTDGEMVGVYDYYDFNMDVERDIELDLKTFMTGMAGYLHGATPYKISYGIYEK